MEPPAELTAEELAELKAELQKLRDQLQAVVSGDGDGSSTDEVRLKRVLAALHKLPSGDYGYCEECEEPIGYDRLADQPAARLCLECQQARA